MVSDWLTAVESRHLPIAAQHLSIGHQPQSLPRSDNKAPSEQVWWRELTAPIAHQNRRQAYERSCSPARTHWALLERSCTFVGFEGLIVAWEVPLFWVERSAYMGRHVIFSSPPSPGRLQGISYSTVTPVQQCDVDDMVCEI